MNEHDFVDAVELYEFARGWYAAEINAPQPIPEWNQLVSDLQNSGAVNEPLGIYLGEKFAKPVDHSMIAVLAAISVGMPRESLLDVIKQNDLTVKSLLRCKFADVNYGDEGDEEYEFVEDEFNPVEMTPWHITNEIIQAVSLDPDLSRNLAAEYSAGDTTQNLQVAAAFAKNEAFWPSKGIKHALETGIRNRGPLEQATPSTNVLYCGADFANMPDDEIIQFLENSGNLLPECSQENGFENSFFRALFLKVSEKHGKNLIALANALNNAEDPDQLASLDERILIKLCDFEYDDFTGGLPVLKGIQMSLDESKYPSIRNSMIFKLNAMPLERIEKIKEENLDEHLGTGTDQFFSEPQSIFASLSDDLMAIAPEDFRKGHFRAIGEFLKHRVHDQDLAQVDLNAVLLKIMQGLEAYLATVHYDYKGTPTEKLKAVAEKHVGTLVAWLAPVMDIDYAEFAKLSSTSKALLASNGLDIRKLPRMTLQDKGRVLSDQLGM